jgi:hypothetical protein
MLVVAHALWSLLNAVVNAHGTMTLPPICN